MVPGSLIAAVQGPEGEVTSKMESPAFTPTIATSRRPDPGVFAKVVTTVDEMSGGRIEVGVGAGWNTGEHRELGLDFPPPPQRVDLMEDQLAMLHGYWGEPDGWSHQGKRVTVEGAQFYPKPVQIPGRPVTAIGTVRPRILVGGDGKPRSIRLAARYADEWIVSIRDVTPLAHEIRTLVSSGELETATRLLPQEQSYPAGDELLAHLRS